MKMFCPGDHSCGHSRISPCLSLVTVSLALILLCRPVVSYDPTWDSLDARPLPAWYDEAKIGIFIHWGVFSVPSFKSEWFWHFWHDPTSSVSKYMKDNYKPDFTYGDFAKDFTAEFFNADEWAKLFEEAGARYIVFTSKHHEGYTNWPSKYSFGWGSMDVGPKRDLVGELRNATIKRKNLRFGLYHSMYEWYNPLYLADKNSGFESDEFVKFKTMPELYELVNEYLPEVIYSDGDWEANDTYWRSKDFLAWLYNESPVKDTIVVNDRWGHLDRGKHGGTFTYDDRFDPGVLVKHKWVNAMTLDSQSWSYRRNAPLRDYLTIESFLQLLVRTVSCGGNLLVNVGPPSHGHISPIYEERLRQMGAWLKVNGEGIYGSRPWTFQNDTLTRGVWYTTKPTSADSTRGRTVYAFLYHWPETDQLTLAAPKMSLATSTVSLVGYSGEKFQFKPKEGPRGVTIIFPDIPVSKLPNLYLWGLKLTGVEN